MQDRGRYICNTPDDMSCVQNISSSDEVNCDGKQSCVIAFKNPADLASPNVKNLPEPIESLHVKDNCGFSIDIKPGMKKFTLAGIGEPLTSNITESISSDVEDVSKPNKNLVCTIIRSNRRESREPALECHRDGAIIEQSKKERRPAIDPAQICSTSCTFSITPKDSVQCHPNGCSVVIGNAMTGKPESIYELAGGTLPNIAFALEYEDTDNGIFGTMINIDGTKPNDIDLRGNLNCSYNALEGYTTTERDEKGNPVDIVMPPGNALHCTIVAGQCPKPASIARQSSPKKQRRN